MSAFETLRHGNEEHAGQDDGQRKRYHKTVGREESHEKYAAQSAGRTPDQVRGIDLVYVLFVGHECQTDEQAGKEERNRVNEPEGKPPGRCGDKIERRKIDLDRE